jgi:hypothetical protein
LWTVAQGPKASGGQSHSSCVRKPAYAASLRIIVACSGTADALRAASHSCNSCAAAVRAPPTNKTLAAVNSRARLSRSSCL